VACLIKIGVNVKWLCLVLYQLKRKKVSGILSSPTMLLLPVPQTRKEVFRMKRITINALVDIGCLITFIPTLVSGLVLYFVLPSGGGQGSGRLLFLGIARNQWVTMHNNSSLVFAVLLIIHLILHWMFFRNIKKCLMPKGKQECETM
jgi:hypothetical protein